ncbi:MAG TPA: Clp protease N-terminal domain-containing protein, partial [Gemmatimonadaceae bacterium]
LPYTSRAKKVLELAMSEARELNHSYVGTEHLLLGLLREEKGIAAQVLVWAGLTLERTRQETVRLLGVAPAKDRLSISATAGRMTMSASAADPSGAEAVIKQTIVAIRLLNPRAHRVMAIAHEEATRRRDREVGPTHILLGLLQGDGLAARLLAEAGLTVDAVRAELERNAP